MPTEYGPWKINRPTVGRIVTKIVEGATGFFNAGASWETAPYAGGLHDPVPAEAYDEAVGDCGCGCSDPEPEAKSLFEEDELPDEPEDRFYIGPDHDEPDVIQQLRDTVHDLELAEAQRDAFALALILLEEDLTEAHVEIEALTDEADDEIQRLHDLYEIDRRAWVGAVAEAIRERNDLARRLGDAVA